MRNPAVAVLVLVLGMMVVVNVGCMKCGESMSEKIAEKAMEKAIETGSGGKAKVDVGKDVDLSSLPAEARYPGAKGTGRWSMSTEDGEGTNWVMETADDKGKVKDWYIASLTGAGYTKAAEMETGEGVVLIFGKDEQKTGYTVSVAAEEDKTTISVLHLLEK